MADGDNPQVSEPGAPVDKPKANRTLMIVVAAVLVLLLLWWLF